MENVNKSAVDQMDEDDFEIVSDSSLKINDESGVTILSDSESQEITMTDRSPTKSVSSVKPTTLDPSKTFEFIHSELRDEILAQQELADVLFVQKNKAKELCDRISLLTSENIEKDERLKNIDIQLKTYKEASENVDELSAKLCESEDQIKFYKDVMEQLKQDGGSVFVQQPHLMTDANLVQEMKEKDEKIDALAKELVEKENARIQAVEENVRLTSELENLSNLTVALQAQVDSDQVDIREMRSTYDERIKMLTEELNSRKTMMNTSRDNTLVDQQSVVEPVTLSHGEVHRHTYECERCKLRLPNADIYKKHVLRCPSILDNLF